MKRVTVNGIFYVYPFLGEDEDATAQDDCLSAVCGSGVVTQYIKAGAMTADKISDLQLALHYISRCANDAQEGLD